MSQPRKSETITGHLRVGGQTTLPEPVIDALRLREGDVIAYRVDGDRVVISKGAVATDDPFASFVEWSSEADEKAYGSL